MHYDAIEDMDFSDAMEVAGEKFKEQNDLLLKNSSDTKKLRRVLNEFSEATSFLVDNPELVDNLAAAARVVAEIESDAKDITRRHTDLIVKVDAALANINFRMGSLERSMDKFLAVKKSDDREDLNDAG
jgi:hypothetical protein